MLAGSSYALESLEPSFNADLNSDGTTGVKTSLIASNGPLALLDAADEFEITSGGTLQGVLQAGGSPIISGNFAGFNPIAVLANSGGYEVMFKGSLGFVGLEFSNTGIFLSAATSVLAANSPDLWAQETLFGADLNSDGQIGTPHSAISVDKGTTLLLSGANYFFTNGSGVGPEFLLNGAAVTTSTFGTYNLIGAVVSGGGYEVALKDSTPGSNNYILLATDSTGNFTSVVTNPAVVTGQDFSLEQQEPVFGQDLNGDGRLATVVSSGISTLSLTSASANTIVQLAANATSATGGLNAGTLSLAGSASTLFLSAASATIEVSLQSSTGVEVISGFQYTIDALNIDLKGAASSVLTAADILVSGSHAIAIYASTDPAHGIVLAGASVSGYTAANLVTSHTSFVGGHAIIT